MFTSMFSSFAVIFLSVFLNTLLLCVLPPQTIDVKLAAGMRIGCVHETNETGAHV